MTTQTNEFLNEPRSRLACPAALVAFALAAVACGPAGDDQSEEPVATQSSAESASSVWADLKKLGGQAKEISGNFSSVVGGVETAIKIAEVLGIIDSGP